MAAHSPKIGTPLGRFYNWFNLCEPECSYTALLAYLRRLFSWYEHRSGDGYFDWRFATPFGSVIQAYMSFVRVQATIG